MALVSPHRQLTGDPVQMWSPGGFPALLVADGRPNLVASRMAGSWRIVEMDFGIATPFDLVGSAFIELNADRTGRFRFVAVEAFLDCRYGEGGDCPKVEFTWEGNDGGDHASGRGWAKLETDGSLRGHIFFHTGDDSGFRAVRRQRASGTSRAGGGHLKTQRVPQCGWSAAGESRLARKVERHLDGLPDLRQDAWPTLPRVVEIRPGTTALRCWHWAAEMH